MQALREARANNPVAGLYQSAADAAALDAFAHGQLDRGLRADLPTAQPRE